MIDQYFNVTRRSLEGDNPQLDGPVLKIKFGFGTAWEIFENSPASYHYMDLGSRAIHGFALDDKFHVIPRRPEEIIIKSRHPVSLDIDPGGDVYLGLHQLSGQSGIQTQPASYRFPIAELTDQPEGFTRRGLDTLYLPTLALLSSRLFNN